MDTTDDKSEKSESEEHRDNNDVARSTMYKRHIFGRQKTRK